MTSPALEARYEIEQTVAGGESVVYRAKDRNLGWTVAIKTPDEKTMADSRRLERFVEEGRKLARIHHDNVLRVHQFHPQGEIDERCYLVTEWMDHSLEDVLEDRRLEPGAALDIVGKIGMGLRAIHAAGIVHRDLKADNVLLSAGADRVVIGDLGIASDVGASDTLVGTPKYMAPEVHEEGEPVDARSDIYSLGFIAYETLLGRDRFKKVFSDIYASETAKIQRLKWVNWHRSRDLTTTPLHELEPGIPEAVSDTVARMLSKDPHERPASMDAVLRGLGALADADDSPIRPISVQDAPKGKLASLPSWVPFAAGGALLVLGTVGFLALRGMGAAGEYDRAAAGSEAMWAAREAAIQAGAETPPIAEFVRGESERESAALQIDAEAYTEAADQFDVATASFLEAEELARFRASSGVLEARRSASEARRQAGASGADESDAGYQAAQQLFIDADALLKGRDYRSAAAGFAEAARGFQALAVAPTPLGTVKLAGGLFRAGSTPEERAEALALCARYREDCVAEWYTDETLREVEIGPLLVHVNEVSFEDFARFVEATGHETEAEKAGFAMAWNGRVWAPKAGLSWRDAKAVDRQRPVTTVNAGDAEAFCAWAGMRLPTEDEWEYLARGSDRRIFPWGDEWADHRARWKTREGIAPAPVGFHGTGRTPEGVFDLAGNVWEWTSTAQGADRVLKGGSFDEDNPANLRSAARRLNPPGAAHPDDGFRCVADAR